MTETGDKIRLDLWLWYARFFKTRSKASQVCKAHKVRVNGEHSKKASTTITPGDVLTFPQGPHVRVVKVLACGARRGPAAEAQALYEDLAPVEEQKREQAEARKSAPALRQAGAGRPTKAERRAIDKLMDR
ncbi:RNA-binding S4 domain-containing protein [Kordiimonas lacus]|uniref:Ribosome-associated heat shock protein Hsp15 n=1 Tax=Kordiimonas lacus TaxID=637679 RepID=A0A1G6TZQ4_9PROT|nr:RNA-binding S4 domain-containing protein [Kordiimonas lacus]SDD33765.1 ribosome-associated heat shock protein Hsp15 [Kordiimonas lacus]